MTEMPIFIHQRRFGPDDTMLKYSMPLQYGSNKGRMCDTRKEEENQPQEIVTSVISEIGIKLHMQTAPLMK